MNKLSPIVATSSEHLNSVVICSYVLVYKELVQQVHNVVVETRNTRTHLRARLMLCGDPGSLSPSQQTSNSLPKTSWLTFPLVLPFLSVCCLTDPLMPEDCVSTSAIGGPRPRWFPYGQNPDLAENVISLQNILGYLHGFFMAREHVHNHGSFHWDLSAGDLVVWLGEISTSPKKG